MYSFFPSKNRAHNSNIEEDDGLDGLELLKALLHAKEGHNDANEQQEPLVAAAELLEETIGTLTTHIVTNNQPNTKWPLCNNQFHSEILFLKEAFMTKTFMAKIEISARNSLKLSLLK